MSYEDRLGLLADKTVKEARAAYASYISGRISDAELADLLGLAIAKARRAGSMLAIARLRAFLEEATGAPVPIDVPFRPGHTERISGAIMKILAVSEAQDMRIERMAHNEPLQAAAETLADGMAADERVTGWVRELESDACQLCQWWWREGRVFRPEHAMPRHTGCMCAQSPVVRKRTSNFQTEKQAADAARRRR